MFRQLVAQPWALLMVSGVLVLFALLPGFPTVIFALLAAIIVSFWYQLQRRARSGAGAPPVGQSGTAARVARASGPRRCGPCATERDAGALLPDQIRCPGHPSGHA